MIVRFIRLIFPNGDTITAVAGVRATDVLNPPEDQSRAEVVFSSLYEARPGTSIEALTALAEKSHEETLQ